MNKYVNSGKLISHVEDKITLIARAEDAEKAHFLTAAANAYDSELQPGFDYMAEADKTCSIIFGSQHVNRDGMVHVLRNFIGFSQELNLLKKLLFRGKTPADLGLPEPALHESLSVEWPHNTDEAVVNVVHGIVGVCTEAGEAAEILLRMIESASGQSFDAINVAEEAGDLRWYIARMLRGIGMTDEACERMNIDKLHGRHGDKFDPFRDANRDLAAERAKLEADFTPPPAPLFDDPTERFHGDYRTTADAEAKFATGSDASPLSSGVTMNGDALVARMKAARGPVEPVKMPPHVGTEPAGVAAVLARTPKDG